MDTAPADYKSKVALITGAAQGIGKAIAIELAEQKYIILAADLDLDGLKQLQQDLDTTVQIYPGDLTDPKLREEMFYEVWGFYERVDVLINNAGITHEPAPLYELSLEELRRNMAVNLEVPFALMHECLPHMLRRQQGTIINITSTANIDGYPDLSIYAATKAALASLTDSVARETDEFPNLKSVAVMPARTNTEMQRKVRGTQVAADSQSPRVIATVIGRLLSGEQSFNSGDNVVIRNGFYCIEDRISG